MVLYGVGLLTSGAPFFIFPLNNVANFIFCCVIFVSLKKFDWRNSFILIASTLLLLQDKFFLSFFTTTISTETEKFQDFSIIIFLIANLFFFSSLFEKSRKSILYVFSLLFLSSFLFLFFGIYGLTLISTIGLLYTISSKNPKIEFLKVYWMFFIFMMLNHVFTINFYNL